MIVLMCDVVDGVGCGNWGGSGQRGGSDVCICAYVYASWPVQSVCAMYEEREKVRVGVSE